MTKTPEWGIMEFIEDMLGSIKDSKNILDSVFSLVLIELKAKMLHALKERRELNRSRWNEIENKIQDRIDTYSENEEDFAKLVKEELGYAKNMVILTELKEMAEDMAGQEKWIERVGIRRNHAHTRPSERPYQRRPGGMAV